MKEPQKLYEGSNDRLVGMLSKECMEALKKGQKKYLTSMGMWGNSVLFEFHWDFSNDMVGVMHAGYYLAKEWAGKRGAKDKVVISFLIGVEVGYKVSDYYRQIAYTLRHVIAHELEHVSQMRDKNRVDIDYAAAMAADDSGAEYMMQPHEVAAFAKGVYMEAKTRKIPFSQVARNLVSAFQSAFQQRGTSFTDQDRERVIKAWEGWATANLPRATVFSGTVAESHILMSYEQFIQKS